MSHPLTVPEGWVRGERLEKIGSGPRYALRQDWTTQEAFDRIMKSTQAAEEVAFITFDSEHDRERFLVWWNE